MVLFRSGHQDILRRIAVHDKHVCFETGFDLPPLIELHQVVGNRGCAVKGVDRRHAAIDHIGHFHCIFAMQVEGGTRIRAHRDLTASFIEHFKAFFVFFEHAA